MTERVLAWLRDAGVAFQVIEHAPVFTSEQAAAVRGTRLAEGAKALVVLAEDRPAHLVLPADRKVDNARLRALLGTRKLRFATRAELLTLTGCTPGGVPPFGHLFDLPVYLEAALTDLERVAFNAGSNTVSIIMGAADLVRLCGATVCRFAAAS